MNAIVNSKVKIDEERINKIKSNLRNKYQLRHVEEDYEKVVFPPGTNLLSKPKCVHWGRMSQCVEEGYVIKPHPITTDLFVAKLKRVSFLISNKFNVDTKFSIEESFCSITIAAEFWAR